MYKCVFLLFFFFNDTATTEIYTLSLHDALPISSWRPRRHLPVPPGPPPVPVPPVPVSVVVVPLPRSEEHTSELQSRGHLVCRLLLEKKKKKIKKLKLEIKKKKQKKRK